MGEGCLLVEILDVLLPRSVAEKFEGLTRLIPLIYGLIRTLRCDIYSYLLTDLFDATSYQILYGSISISGVDIYGLTNLNTPFHA